ncbi:MAG: transketolase [Candidatus Rokubacteria bacterium 13_1_40CM_4_69_39]|nr:MAG: transketolase [Candidatus Rokubacteria bacterium 13_1_40CM_69_96]OLC58360.1 MAG: transketolase [Candidatus Rokubacteria bacterium 13_1_40CM_4_69_39]OLC96935.1 MAG: transketolase [Candidatus Rokubacteria bacterium 13_1_40CM_3_69_38]
MTDTKLDQLCVNTIRTLSIDAVQQARSGHPGTPMALAPLVYTLWNRVMRFDPQDAIWPNRDRFVLSNGHASMLLWSVLHLTGTRAVNADYERLGQPAVTLGDIRHFRQLDSKAPGHPEYHWVSGVETTSGPLGQGVATSVGMAIGQKWLASRYNRPGFDIFDYHVYAVCGDGCLMEGVASEAASLAGHLGLDNLCWIYDNNHITIEGDTRLAFTEDVAARFLGYGWNVQRVGDANDMDRIEHALEVFRQTKGRPTIIILDSHIGYGSPHKHDTAEAHGEPLGEEEVRLTKRSYGWPEDARFLVPAGVYEHFTAGMGARGAAARRRWTDLFEAYRAQYGALANEIDLMQRRELPANWDSNLPVFPADPKGVAGRDASGKVLNVLAQNIPWFLGGSADLGPSNRTTLTYEGAGDFQAESPGGKNLHFGIREHAMAATVNGLALSKLRAFGATFFIFSDYARPAIRLSAVMELPTIFVFTHDAMGDGEDGPTHQPVEQLASLRAIPGLITLRPGDANEVVEAYRYVMQRRHEPAVLALSRQPLPTLDRNKYAPASGLARGAYILGDAPTGKPEVILIASGSEVSLAVEAHEQLLADGIRSRVVSLPSWDIFEHQTQEYRDSVLPPSVTARVAVEQASTLGWERYVGTSGRVIGMQTFGASAPLKELQKKFGFQPDRVAAAAREQLGR